MACVSRQPQISFGPIQSLSSPSLSSRRTGTPFCEEPPSPVVKSYRFDPHSITCPSFLKENTACSICYHGQKGGDSSGEEKPHFILFKDNAFTVDGINYRKVDDPKNASFFKSLEKWQVPDEFGDGMHVINIRRFAGMDVINKGWEWSHNDEDPELIMYSDEGSSESWQSSDEGYE